MLFVDRADAGRHLAQRLRHLRGTVVIVLGLPRGGVPVAFEVAGELRAPPATSRRRVLRPVPGGGCWWR
jgi:putative phosphoribosyl transferase